MTILDQYYEEMVKNNFQEMIVENGKAAIEVNGFQITRYVNYQKKTCGFIAKNKDSKCQDKFSMDLEILKKACQSTTY